MANSVLGVTLKMQADAQQAKKSLADLKNDLTKLGTMSELKPGQTITTSLQQASSAAVKLHASLEKATNVNTGNLNLTTFRHDLERSGQSLNSIRKQLSKAGPEGQAAFQQLTSAIRQADTELNTGNAMLEKFKQSLASVLTWNISSSIFNVITSQLKEAVGYAKDLNTTLNDIRIVTGKNADQMSQFAKYANESAQKLGISTKEYVKASTLFFQQGLNESEVKKRTDITMRMATVTGEAAEDVSSYMTAIWNNFAKGGEDLESYADKLTALGAATAASTEEIARSLEKFAAIADTVGLSYTNAAAAVATVIDKTRQSADTVGTAFKTIFGRMEGLTLGETLDDGTNLNKYSMALQSVGIDIKDQNGALKDMDTILEEMGEKWKTLSKDQQVALAQTVGGVRQYNNLIALMNNYSDFEMNVEISQKSQRELRTQASIYGDSWEAATMRVKAELESLYDSLINDDTMIELLDFLKDVIHNVKIIARSMGGVRGIIQLVGKTLLDVKRTEITKFFNDAGGALLHMIPGVKQLEQYSNTMMKKEAARQEIIGLGLSNLKDQVGVFKDQSSAQERMMRQSSFIMDVSKRLTPEQRQQAQQMFEQYKNMELQLQNLKEQKEQIDKRLKQLKLELFETLKKQKLDKLAAEQQKERQDKEKQLAKEIADAKIKAEKDYANEVQAIEDELVENIRKAKEEAAKKEKELAEATTKAKTEFELAETKRLLLEKKKLEQQEKKEKLEIAHTEYKENAAEYAKFAKQKADIDNLTSSIKGTEGGYAAKYAGEESADAFVMDMSGLGLDEATQDYLSALKADLDSGKITAEEFNEAIADTLDAAGADAEAGLQKTGAAIRNFADELGISSQQVTTYLRAIENSATGTEGTESHRVASDIVHETEVDINRAAGAKKGGLTRSIDHTTQEIEEAQQEEREANKVYKATEKVETEYTETGKKEELDTEIERLTAEAGIKKGEIESVASREAKIDADASDTRKKWDDEEAQERKEVEEQVAKDRVTIEQGLKDRQGYAESATASDTILKEFSDLGGQFEVQLDEDIINSITGAKDAESLTKALTDAGFSPDTIADLVTKKEAFNEAEFLDSVKEAMQEEAVGVTVGNSSVAMEYDSEVGGSFKGILAFEKSLERLAKLANNTSHSLESLRKDFSNMKPEDLMGMSDVEMTQKLSSAGVSEEDIKSILDAKHDDSLSAEDFAKALADKLQGLQTEAAQNATILEGARKKVANNDEFTEEELTTIQGASQTVSTYNTDENKKDAEAAQFVDETTGMMIGNTSDQIGEERTAQLIAALDTLTQVLTAQAEQRQGLMDMDNTELGNQYMQEDGSLDQKTFATDMANAGMDQGKINELMTAQATGGEGGMAMTPEQFAEAIKKALAETGEVAKDKTSTLKDAKTTLETGGTVDFEGVSAAAAGVTPGAGSPETASAVSAAAGTIGGEAEAAEAGVAKLPSIDKKQVQMAEKLSKNFEKITKNSALSADEIKELEKIMNKMKKGNASVKEVNRAMTLLNKNSKKSGTEVKKITKDIAAFGEGEGIQDQVDAMSELQDESAVTGEAIEETGENIKEQGDENVKTLQEMSGVSFGEVVTTGIDAVNTLSMAWEGFKNLGSIWEDDDLSTSEKMMATMTSLSTILPLVQGGIAAITAVTTALTAAKNAENASELTGLALIFAKIKGLKQKSKEEGKSMISTLLATAVQWAQNLAIASNPWVIGIAIAAFVAAIAIFGAYAASTGQAEQYQKELNEAQEESAEKSAENLAKIKELVEANKELANSFYEAAEAAQAGSGGYEAAAKAANDYLDKYAEIMGIDRDTLPFYTAADMEQRGDEIEEEIRQKESETARINAENAAGNVENVVAYSRSKMKSTNTFADNDDKMDDGDADVINLLSEFKKTELGEKNSHYLTVDGNSLKINIPADASGTEVMDAYDYVGNFLSYVDKSAKETAHSEIYDKLDQWYSDNNDYYSKISEANDTEVAAKQQAGFTSASIVKSDGSKVRLTTLEEGASLADYAELRDQFIDTVGGDEDLASDYLVQQDGPVASLEYIMKGKVNPMLKKMAEGTIDRGTLTLEEAKNYIFDFYDQMDAAGQSAFAALNIDKMTSLSDLPNMVNEQMGKSLDFMIASSGQLAGLSEDAIESFKNSFVDGAEEIDNTTRRVIKRTLELSDSVAKVSESWDSLSENLAKATKGTATYYKYLSEMQTGVNEAFGVDLDISWYEDAKNVRLIDRAMHGEEGALEEFYASAGRHKLTQLSSGDDAKISSENAQALAGILEADTPEEASALLNGKTWTDFGIDPNSAEGKKIIEDLQKSYGKELEMGFDAQGNYTFTGNIIQGDASKIDKSLLLEDNEVRAIDKQNAVIEEAAAALDKLSEAKDKAYGGARIAAIQAEKEATEQLKEKYATLLDTIDEAQATNFSDIQTLMSEYGDNEDIATYFNTDDQGNIIGFKDEAQEQAFKEKYRNDTKMMEYYDKYSDYEEAAVSAQEGYDQQVSKAMDLALEEHEYRVELRVAMSEQDLAKIDHSLSLIQGKAYRATETFAKMEEKFQTILADSAASVEEGKRALTVLSETGLTIEEFYGLTTDQQAEILSPAQMEALQELPAKLRENETALYELKASYEETMMTVYDEFNNDLANAMASFDTFKSTMDSYQAIMETAGVALFTHDAQEMNSLLEATDEKVTEKMLYNESLNKLNETRQKTIMSQIEGAQNQVAAYEEALKAANEGYQKAIDNQDTDSAKVFREQVENLEASIEEANATILGSWEEALSNAQAIFTAHVQQTIEALNNALGAGFGTLADLQQKYSQQKTLDSQYLDDYQKIYELSKMTRQLEGKIDDTDNIRAKQEMSKLMEKINAYQAEGVEMSQNDLNILQKEYDLELARIALEEARNAKTEMRLTRNAEGGISYIYTANQDALDKAQQDYEDKMYALQQSNEQYIDTISSQWLTMEQELTQQITDIYNNPELSPDEKARKSAEIVEYYQKQFTWMNQEMGKTLTSNNAMYEKDWLNYEGYAQKKIELATSWSETDLGGLIGGNDLGDRLNTLTAELGSYDPASGQGTGALGALGNIQKTYTDSVTAVTELVSGNGSFVAQLDNATGEIATVAEQNVSKVAEAGAALSSNYASATEKISEFQKTFKAAMESLQSDTGGAIAAIENLIKAMGIKYSITGEVSTIDTSSENGDDMGSAASGAYLPSWGSEGKVMMVHEEELILNKFQTKDLFAIAEMATAYMSQVASISQVPNLMSVLGETIGAMTNNSNTVQEITIHADFPNVSSSEEIEKAFENIANMASQYANRTE